MNMLSKLLVYGVLLGSVSPTFADEFESFLERTGKSPQTLQRYQERKQEFQTKDSVREKDRIARGIFTDISIWKLQEEWELEEATFLFLREVRNPLFAGSSELNQEEYRELHERHARVVNGHRLRAEQALKGVEAADERLKYWFSQREGSQFEENDSDIHKDAYRLWVKAQCAAVCVERFQWHFWDNEWYNPYCPVSSSPELNRRIPLDAFQVELSRFLGVRDDQPMIHPHITNELNLQECVSLQDRFVTYKLLLDLCEQALGEFDALWDRKEPVGR